jgi:hypothetical protein
MNLQYAYEASLKSQSLFERKVSTKRARTLRKKGVDVYWNAEENTYVWFMNINNPKHKKVFNNFN